ncbi:glutamine-hydrolyzing carbamoyl-phosphate synthase small subunit [Clostridium cylindrosporum]|uniref:Carbamoyl phosphate synthase small chain n=1 Tax=Clostridium cylindrosporum DSM 605 TaxID=1121307 RepID=A0A0J8D4J8_CLOCY|nr:glutamine-hydrolyzing carbamoyl-phosphate synthase small subunit [Clostridium cylindrosporum]KMT21090.1 carbamoyl-phosphate synthase small chain CarA [Clostridium cylindrosporum DSM 605]
MKGIIYLQDGSVFEGKGLGHKGTSVGEIVFNTSMAGYQEIITDPSAAGQIITMTYPLIGNYGVNSEFNESKGVYVKGLIVKTICRVPSNFMGIEELNNMLSENKVVVVEDIDTRSITRIIRENGTQKCVITTEDISKEEAMKLMDEYTPAVDSMKKLGTDKVYTVEGSGCHVAAIDLGTKGSVLKALNQKGCKVTVFPYGASFDEIMSVNPQGIFLTDGPGNPEEAVEVIELTKKFIEAGKPVFGVSLGCNIVALAQGAKTYKLSYGHRGSNHGVRDVDAGKCFITSQSHAYAVDENSIKETEIEVTHINLNDGTVEGIKNATKPVFAVQFIPEGEPGPSDTDYLLNKFINLMSVEG